MPIVAKFAGRCLACGEAISVGEQINWKKGEGSSHVTCGGANAAHPKTLSRQIVPQGAREKPPVSPRKPKYPTTAPEPGAHEISGRRTDRHDERYRVGRVLRLPKVDVGGGWPDGTYYTVLAHRLVRPNEDMGIYSWTEQAWVRAATADESATLAAKIRREEAPKTLTAYVIKTVRAGDRLTEEEARSALPATADAAIEFAKEDLQRVVIAGDVVIGYHGGHYDDYRASAWRCAVSPVLAQAIRALASKNADDMAVAADAILETT